jgi:Caspase domain
MAKVALLIGVSEYASGLNPLPAALNDIAELKKILDNPEMGGFDDVKSLPNPDSQTMQIEIERLFRNRAKTDLLLLYFSGHGIRDERGNFYFATKNTQKELVAATAVPARFVHDVMSGSRSVHQAIILDSCNSEAFDPEYQTKSVAEIDFQAQLGAKGRVVLASSAFNEYSYERKGDRLSVYTQHLVEGMTSGNADIDHDGYISMQDLHDYASNCFRGSDCEMTPKIIMLKGEGLKLRLSKVKSVDPNQYYLDTLADILKRGNGEISAIDSYILSNLQTECGLSNEAADRYQESAIKPYRERERKIKLFKLEVMGTILSKEKPGQQTEETRLSQIRQSYRKVLTAEDIATAETEIRAQIEALPVTNIPVTPLRREPVDSYSVPQTSASQDQSTPDKIKSIDSVGAGLLMKPWMKLSGGFLGLCSLLSAGYVGSLFLQPQQLPGSVQQLSTNESKTPVNSVSPNNDEVRRVEQIQINENYRANQESLDRAKIALDRDDWKSWEQAIAYAKTVLTLGDRSQKDKADKITREAESKMDDEIRRVKEANAMRAERTPKPIVKETSSPVVAPPLPQSSPETSSGKMSKPACESFKDKYNDLDSPTMDQLNAPGSTIRKICYELGVVINQ